MSNSSARQVVDIAAHSMETQAEQFVNLYSSDSSYDFRKSNLLKLKQTGYPNIRQEAWKYTDLGHIAKEKFELNTSLNNNYSEELLDKIRQYIAKNSRPSEDIVVVLDGVFISSLSVLRETSNKVESINIDNGILLKSVSNGLHLTHVAGASSKVGNSIVNYINSCYLDGVNISVTDSKSVNNIRIINIVTEHSLNKIINVKNYCSVGENCNLNIIEDYAVITTTSSNLKRCDNKFNGNFLFDINLDQDAVCKHYIVQDNNADNYQLAYYNINQSKNSEYVNYNINLGTRLARQDIVVNQNEDSASCSLNGVFLANDKQHMDSQLKVYHNSSHGKSVQNYRAVLADRAHGVFNGMVYVAEGTVNNSAEQSNKNILLSKHAEMDTKPELQIYADDVSCSHGATIGKLDEQVLFYLQSRGIDKLSAKAMLIVSFINNIVENIEDENVLDWIKTKFNTKLDALTEA